MAMANASNTTAPTQFIQTKLEKYAYRRFGKGNGLPLLCLQHFTGTLDNWHPAVADPLALGREVILFESAGSGPFNWPGPRKHGRDGGTRPRIRRYTWPKAPVYPRLLPRWNGGAAGGAGTSLARPQNAACRHRSGGRRGHYAHG